MHTRSHTISYIHSPFGIYISCIEQFCDVYCIAVGASWVKLLLWQFFIFCIVSFLFFFTPPTIPNFVPTSSINIIIILYHGFIFNPIFLMMIRSDRVFLFLCYFIHFFLFLVISVLFLLKCEHCSQSVHLEDSLLEIEIDVFSEGNTSRIACSLHFPDYDESLCVTKNHALDKRSMDRYYHFISKALKKFELCTHWNKHS